MRSLERDDVWVIKIVVVVVVVVTYIYFHFSFSSYFPFASPSFPLVFFPPSLFPSFIKTWPQLPFHPILPSNQQADSPPFLPSSSSYSFSPSLPFFFSFPLFFLPSNHEKRILRFGLRIGEERRKGGKEEGKENRGKGGRKERRREGGKIRERNKQG